MLRVSSGNAFNPGAAGTAAVMSAGTEDLSGMKRARKAERVKDFW